MADHTFICKNCHRSVDLDFYGARHSFVQTMKEKQLCFDCLFWENTLQKQQPDTYIISGGLWVFHPAPNIKQKSKIFKKGMLFVRNMITGEVLASEDYVFRGNLPKHIQEKYPDQLKFIANTTYFKIIHYQGSCCLCKGCFDRYNCFWYNQKLAEHNGAWNRIPPGYKVGSEKCISFINKNTMYDCTIFPPFCSGDL